jgi:hypothetical protein
MNRFSYWISFFLSAALAWAGISYFTSSALTDRPERPALSIFGQVFPSEYSAAGWTTVHDIYFHGLFGAGTRLRQADLFLLGSSHVEFGLSAAQLSEQMSRPGHPVRVFNLGVGCHEAIDFDLDILSRNQVVGRSAIADTYTLYSEESSCAQRTRGFDTVQAYVSVFKIWSKLSYDWLFDPYFARIKFDEQGSHVQRFMSGSLIEESWETGDAVLAWHPVTGSLYPNSVQPLTDIVTAAEDISPDIDWRLDAPAMSIPAPILQQARRLSLDLSVTLMPWAPLFPGEPALYRQLTALLRSEPTSETLCFSPIPAAGLSSFDKGLHYSGAAKALATSRLAGSLTGERCSRHGEQNGPRG